MLRTDRRADLTDGRTDGLAVAIARSA